MLGYVNVATADTMLACWEAKYHYNFWRPTHAIQRADTDGNPDTIKDPTWLPLVVGNHPVPVRPRLFHRLVTESLRQYFGTKKVKLVITSLAPGAGPPRTYDTLDELVKDVENARVWGGLHYRSTMTETAKDFPRIARDVGKRFFLPRGDGGGASSATASGQVRGAEEQRGRAMPSGPPLTRGAVGSSFERLL